MTQSVHVPLWLATSYSTSYPRLRGRYRVDVAIIGAGITGITAAALLKRAGKTVALIEKNQIACGESGHTTAHLTEMIDAGFETLISHFGKQGAKTAVQSSRAAIEQIEAFIQDLGIDCGFKKVTAYLYSESEKDLRYLDTECRAARKLGVTAELITDVPLPFETHAGIQITSQAQFHPRRYLLSLASTIPGDGSHIFEKTRVTDIADGGPCLVRTESGEIEADQVIVATDSMISNRFALHTKVAAYRTYAVAARIADAEPLEGLYWDTEDPYHYIRTETVEENGRRNSYLIVGGEDRKVGLSENSEQRFRELEKWTRKRFQVGEFTHRWSGQILVPVDGLPYIGRSPGMKNVFVSTGYNGNGMTFGTLGAMVVSDLILTGQPSAWSRLYEATRVKPLAGAKEFVMENKDFPICFLRDRVRKPDVGNVSEIGTGDGAVIEAQGEKIAVHRDELGTLHAFSPVCPHMGCHVNWNGAEKSWDCPCHGSRFGAADGKVLHGPAVSGLKPLVADSIELENPPQKTPRRKRAA